MLSVDPPPLCHLDRSRTVSSSCAVERPAGVVAFALAFARNSNLETQTLPCFRLNSKLNNSKLETQSDRSCSRPAPQKSGTPRLQPTGMLLANLGSAAHTTCHPLPRSNDSRSTPPRPRPPLKPPRPPQAALSTRRSNPFRMSYLGNTKIIFLKFSPKLACQAPLRPKKRQNPHEHWRIIFENRCTFDISSLLFLIQRPKAACGNTP
jgi:hypothetical protein